jgi:hypothetical protein
MIAENVTGDTTQETISSTSQLFFFTPASHLKERHSTDGHLCYTALLRKFSPVHNVKDMSTSIFDPACFE